MNNKFLGMLGLAKRAGKVQTGEDICSKAVKSGVSKLIIVACDASDNTKKSITDSCKFYKTKFVEAGRAWQVYTSRQPCGSFRE